MRVARATTVDEHLAALPDDRRATMEGLRQTIRDAAPDAVETIAYDMPAFRTANGKFLVSFDAYQRHYSLFPASSGVIDQIGSAVEPYLSGRGTIRFPAARPIPLDLVRQVVEIRVAETAKER
jgi:uncharacterized protein YdhG (YjbR/CyaY superfamily)